MLPSIKHNLSINVLSCYTFYVPNNWIKPDKYKMCSKFLLSNRNRWR